MHLFHRFILLFCSLCITGCALRVPPTGGIKDAEAPKIVKCMPDNNALNFAGNRIEIVFNEYITLQDLSKQLVISPPLPQEPEITTDKKTLLIKLPDSLLANTTYTINMGNAVIDVHESTPYVNLSYVFSTGAFIDSLSCSGRIYDAKTLKTEKGNGVYLYHNLADTVVYNTIPDYVSITNEQGFFSINQLKPGTYKIFAHKDGNSNYKFDSKTEAIAFAHNINLPDSSLQLPLFIEPDTMPHLLKAQYLMPGKAQFIFTAPITQLLFKPIGTFDCKYELGQQKDTLMLYCADTLIDSVHAVVYNGLYLVDTVHVNLKPAKLKTGKGSETVFNLGSNLASGYLEKGQQLTLYFDNPVQVLDTTMVTLWRDSTAKLPLKMEAIDKSNRAYRIAFETSENNSYKLLLPKKCITDLFGNSNDSIEIAFKTRDIKEYANISVRLTFENKSTPLIMLLLTESGHTVRSNAPLNDGSFVFENVLPGKYQLRLIADRNNNGIWDGGSYAKKQQPEKVYNFNETLSSRSNWDVDLNWVIK